MSQILRYEEASVVPNVLMTDRQAEAASIDICYSLDAEMGLAPGGRMKQEIYDDPYGLDAWDQRHASRCFVTIANSVAWTAITGERPPTVPPFAFEYTAAGLPWFDYHGGDAKALAGAEKLMGLKSVLEFGKAKGVDSLPENTSVDVQHIISLGKHDTNLVREMTA